MNQPKRRKSEVKPKEVSAKKASGAALKLVKKNVAEEKLEEVDKEEMANFGDSLDTNDPNFKSELSYDGYRSIEEYDNDVYSGDVERKEDSKSDLKIEDREDDPNMGEENLIDPQENRK